MTTLLAIGDIHLGRPPAAIPDRLRRSELELAPEAAWQACIDAACRHQVDAVLLAGDVVDRGRDFFVAYGELERGVRALAEADIPVIAVAGNHDTRILPRLADEIPSLHLLGGGGKWERLEVAGIDILGWSFPQPVVRGNPLDELDLPSGDRPTIGLLHCDLDQADSPYAPVPRQALAETALLAWLLGHIHRPDQLDQVPGDNQPVVGYLGSVTALRASETGDRGPWLVTVDERSFSARQLVLAPLRYEVIDIDCADLSDASRLYELVLAEGRELATELSRRALPVRAVGLRLRLTGACPASPDLPEAARQLASEAQVWEERGISLFIQKISVETTPALDLARLADQNDPAGLMARRIRWLESSDSPERTALINRARPALKAVLASREFRDLDCSLDEATIADYLARAGRLALTRMMAERESRQ